MRILQIFPGKVWGGAEQYVLDLSLNLCHMGHKVRFVIRQSEAVENRLRDIVEYEKIPLGGIFDFTSPGLLARQVKDVDVVHLHDISQVDVVVKACRIARVAPKIVLTRHIARRSRVAPWKRASIGNVHKIIFVSNLSYKLWHSVNEWFPESKCVVVRNSIPRYSGSVKENLRMKYKISPEVPIIMYTGRVRKSKGCELIIEALTRNKDLAWAMIFVGKCKPDDYDAKLLTKAMNEGIADRVFFYGFSSDVRSLITQASIGVAPSIVREACPLSPMEFMDAGKCVIVTDNGAQKEYITHKDTGIIVKSGDVDSFSIAIRWCLENKTKCEDIGLNAQNYFASEMNYDIFVKKIIKVYK